MELSKGKSHDIENLSIDTLPYEFFERTHETWLLSEVNTFSEITKEMIALQLAGGHLDQIDNIKPEAVEEFLCCFPFTMMNKISGGNFVLVES